MGVTGIDGRIHMIYGRFRCSVETALEGLWGSKMGAFVCGRLWSFVVDNQPSFEILF